MKFLKSLLPTVLTILIAFGSAWVLAGTPTSFVVDVCGPRSATAAVVCLSDANGQKIPWLSWNPATHQMMIATPSSFLQVPNNAALKSFSFPIVPAVLRRMGFGAAGDGGGMDYVHSSSVCSLGIAGAGDDGSQVQGANNDCWIAAFSGPPDARVWGADATGSAVSTTAVNAWLSYVSSSHVVGRLISGSYKLDACLAPVTTSNWGVAGDGGTRSTLSYQGASTTCDIMSAVGPSSSSPLHDITISGIRIASTTTMTTGSHALHLKFTQFVDLSGVVIDGYPYGNRRLYDGAFFESSSFVKYTKGNVWTSHYGVMASDGVELALDKVYFYQMGDTAIYLGGGWGGLYLGEVSVSGGAVGLRIDTSLTGTGNNQVFVSERTTFDTQSAACIYLDDAIASSKTLMMAGWCASTTDINGNGIVDLNWANGNINIAGSAQITNNAGNGIYDNDASSRLTLDAAANLSNNIGYGISCGVSAPNIVSWVQGHNNAYGDYSPACAAGQIVQGYTTYIPAITSASGTITTMGAVSASFTRIGHRINARVAATITANGSGSGALYVTLPAPARDDIDKGDGRNYGTGSALQVFPIAGTLGTAAVLTSVNAYPITADGQTVKFSISYEAQ